MRVRGIVWGGTRTDRYGEMVAFVRDVLGAGETHHEPSFTAFAFEDCSVIEVFDASSDRDHAHFDRGPVVGFLVEDVGAAREELQRRGLEVLGAGEAGGYAWVHVRGPDGNVYELTNGPYGPRSRDEV